MMLVLWVLIAEKQNPGLLLFLAIEYKINECLLAFNPEGKLKDRLVGSQRLFPVFHSLVG